MKIVDFLLGRPRRGFVYAPEAHDGPMANAAPDRIVRIPGRAPPWIVVDHQLSSVKLGRWPGRLWAVEIVDRITDRDLRAANQVGLRPDAGYTRAAAVKILHSVPVASLFGRHGARVCAVIATAAELSLEQAARLAAARHKDAGAAQTRVWKRWLSEERVPLERYDRDLDSTLAIFAPGGPSPVGDGLLVISGEVGRRARTIAGPSVWIVDDTDPEEAWLAEPWSTATSALLDAALAFGAPDLVGDEDSNILATAWRGVIGSPP